MNRVQGSRSVTRSEGVVRFYFDEQGKGFIHADSQDYSFGITDIIGTVAPQINDRVQFSPQLENQTHRARLVVLQSNPQFIDLTSPGTQYRSVALDVRPSSDEIVRQRRTGLGEAATATQIPSGPRHMSCFDCQKLVVPKLVKAGPGLIGTRDNAQWKYFCPRCKSQLNVPPKRRKRLLLLMLALLAGFYWFGQGRLF